MQRTKMYRIPGFLLLQFLVVFLMVTYITARLEIRYGMPVSMVVGSAMGLLLTANLSQGLFALQVVLDRLAHGLPVELASLHRHWPLHTLFQRVGKLEEQFGHQIQIEQQTVAYKDQLMQQIIATAAQEERNRLARDLHDSIKQQIFSITMSAAAAKARWEHDQSRVRNILDDIERTAHEAQVETQAMLQQLRPRALENTGLVESLRMQGEALQYRTGATVTIEIGHLPSEEQLPPGSHEVLFRIVQEGFANIARHARASQIWLSLYQQEQFLLLEMGDDGQGFDISQTPDRSDSGGMGIQNIRERTQALHGTVQIWSMVGKGTTFHITLPLRAQLDSALEHKQEEPELTAVLKQVRRVLNVGLRSIDVAAAAVLLCTPTAITQLLMGICLLLAGSVWLWAHILRLQVVLSMGSRHNNHLSLMVQNIRLLLGLLTFSILTLGYFRYDWLFTWPIAFTLALILMFTVWYFITHDRYCRGLTSSELQKLINKQQQQVGLDFLAWSIVVGCAAFFGILTPDLHAFHFSASMWIQNADLSLCLLWLVINILKGIETVRWQRLLVKRGA